MIPKRYGRIVNISSIGGVLGIEIDPAYAAGQGRCDYSRHVTGQTLLVDGGTAMP